MGKIKQDDLDVWQAAMKDVAKHKKPKQADLAKEFKQALAEDSFDKASQSAEPTAPPVSKPPSKSSPRPTRKTSVASPTTKENRKQRRHLKVDARLDLHHLTQEQAYAKLKQFLWQSYSANHKIILVITGKGLHSGADEFHRPTRGVLREKLPHWVKNDSEITALVWKIAPAKRQDGGDGAFYLYLRRKV